MCVQQEKGALSSTLDTRSARPVIDLHNDERLHECISLGLELWCDHTLRHSIWRLQNLAGRASVQ